jgi:phage gpG-like protein
MHTPPHDLIPSIQTQAPVVISDRHAECDVNVGSIYGAIREFGGIIKATKGEYLTFRTEDGAWHRVPSVMHPAQPYIRPAVDDEEDLQAVGEANLELEIRAAGIT